MTSYRRAHQPGGCYFFTVALNDRRTCLLTDHVGHLHNCFRIVQGKHPFTIDAVVILPDHLHSIWTLPDGDTDFSMRWALIKGTFSRGITGGEEVGESRKKRGERGIWQRRFWEHLIRDERDLGAHVEYIHYNPVKHGLVTRAIDWPHSSIYRYLREGRCDPDWAASPMSLEMDRE